MRKFLAVLAASGIRFQLSSKTDAYAKPYAYTLTNLDNGKSVTFINRLSEAMEAIEEIR